MEHRSESAKQTILDQIILRDLIEKHLVLVNFSLFTSSDLGQVILLFFVLFVAILRVLLFLLFEAVCECLLQVNLELLHIGQHLNRNVANDEEEL